MLLGTDQDAAETISIPVDVRLLVARVLARGPGASKSKEARVTLHVKEAARHVALVTIDNQPKRNALSRTAMSELARFGNGLARRRIAAAW
jgi:hypothetical protein